MATSDCSKRQATSNKRIYWWPCNNSYITCGITWILEILGAVTRTRVVWWWYGGYGDKEGEGDSISSSPRRRHLKNQGKSDQITSALLHIKTAAVSTSHLSVMEECKVAKYKAGMMLRDSTDRRSKKNVKSQVGSRNHSKLDQNTLNADRHYQQPLYSVPGAANFHQQSKANAEKNRPWNMHGWQMGFNDSL